MDFDLLKTGPRAGTPPAVWDKLVTDVQPLGEATAKEFEIELIPDEDELPNQQV